MKPGRDLDVLVAEKVMNARHPFDNSGEHFVYSNSNGELQVDPLPYSTDMASAWQVMNEVQIINIVNSSSTQVMARYGNEENDVVTGDTEPHAICLAALKAVGVDV